VTEEEAKTKWCPMIRSGHVAGMAINSYVEMQKGAIDSWYEQTRCIASGCMMWRSRLEIVANTRDLYKEGYCGLAGSAESPIRGSNA
jgi:hypothetical protein